MSRTFTHLISDCDGVLLDTESVAFDVLQRELADHLPGQDVAAIIRPRLGLTLPDLLADIARHHALSLAALDIPAMRDRVENEVAERLQAVPGVKEALEAIPLPKSVASNSAGHRVRAALRHAGLATQFGDRVFCADEVGAAKPDPALYLAACRAAGAAPEQCLVVEDSVTGVSAAVAAGMTVLGFTGAGHVEDGQADKLLACGAALTFNDMAQLPALISRLRRHEQ
ncbi:HAD-IA family hydrolase [uncultured Aquitalea sp.]|uniref:HAD family hydrolase n=1 Tax=uncultured Aquitalea sp. TaxID=540272 RepID=UPI0025E35FC6|nr:HAD-IA family hydrolase [uncultured Aquitalea sp.]